MKTLQELYNEIAASEELKAAYAEAAKGGNVGEFLKAHGCEATMEEFDAFLKNRSGGELPDDELDNVSGGCGDEPNPYPLHDWEYSCEHQQDYGWDSMWHGECLMCIYSGEEDDANESIRCHYPNRVR